MVSTCRQTITWLLSDQTHPHWQATGNPQRKRGRYLVDIVSGNDGVKHGVEVVQEVHDLHTHTHTELKQARRTAAMLVSDCF